MREFFGITESLKAEWNDLSACITVLNVALILARFWWAPILGITNCILSIVLNVRYRAHINLYVIQIALIVLNIYFLTL